MQNMWVPLLLLFVQKRCAEVESLLLLLNKCALHVDSVYFKHTTASFTSDNKPAQKVRAVKHIWNKIKY